MTPTTLSPWQVALCRLHALRLTDQEIADYLGGLSDAVIRALEAHSPGRWKRSLLARLHVEGAGRKWSRRLVTHHRRRLGLPTWERGRRWGQTLTLHRRRLLVQYASARRWSHLTGRALDVARMLARNTPRPVMCARLQWPPSVVSAWVRAPWDILQRGEIDALEVLAGGPRLVAGRQAYSEGQNYYARLADKGLVVRLGPPGQPFTYQLAPGIMRQAEDFSPTRVEKLYQSLGVA